MGKREIETDCQHHIGHERDKPKELAQEIAMIELTNACGGNQKAHPDIEKREGESFNRAPQVSKLAALGEKKAVEKHFRNEEGEKNAHLEGQVASGSPMRGALELVASAKFVALEFEIPKM